MKSFRQPNSSSSSASGASFTAPGAETATSNQDALASLQTEGAQTVAIDPGSFENPGLVTLPPELFVQILRTAPSSGTVCDLTGGGPVDAGADWVKIDAGGPAWINLSALGPAHRAALVPALQAAQGQFSFAADGRLVLGSEQTEVFLGADAADAESVLQGANDREQDEDVFDFLNGGETALFASQADDTGWDKAGGQTKPGSWYNAYEVKNGKVEPHESDFDKSGRTAPAMDMQGLKDLIKRCLDISGLRKVVGDDQEMFEASMTERFELTSGLSGSAFQAVIDELWCYFRTGAGTDGEVDIGRLQALVRALDPEIQITAETNTPFDGESFSMGDAEIARGDGKFGRATMLSLLHLFGNFEQEVSKPPSVGTVGGGTIGPDDWFMADISPSMGWTVAGGTAGKGDVVKGAVDVALGQTGPGQGMQSRTAGYFNNNRTRVGPRYPDWEVSLRAAYDLLCPNKNKPEQEAFAELFGLTRGDIFDRSGTLLTRELMQALGDGFNEVGRDVGTTQGGYGESPTKAMITALLNPQFLRGAFKKHVDEAMAGNKTETLRLNAVADEMFQSMEYLPLLMAISKRLNVEPRYIVAPYDDSQYTSSPLSKLVFIEAADIKVSKTTPEAIVTYEKNGVSTTDTVQFQFPELDRDGDPHPAATDADRYRGAGLSVGGFQGGGKSTN